MEKIHSVEFTGDGGGTYCATWGQREFWNIINVSRPSGFYQIPWRVSIPGGRSVDDIGKLLSGLVSRHQALRTTVHRDGDGVLRQDIHGSGSLPVWGMELKPGPVAVRRSRELADFLESEPHVDREFALRAVVLTWRGVPYLLACDCSHMVLDGASGWLLDAEIRALLSAPGDAPAGPVTPAWQPSGMAAWEAGDDARRMSDRALAYWRSTLRDAPPSPFPGAAPRGTMPMWRGIFSSPQLRAAETILARRTRLASSSIFLAAGTLVLSQMAGTNGTLFRIVTGNRTDEHLHGYVGALSQHSVVNIGLSFETFDEMARAVHQRLLRACTRSRYDADALRGVVDEVCAERGTEVDLSCLFNDMRPKGFGTASGNDRPPVAADLVVPATRSADEVNWELAHTSNADLTFFLRVLDIAGSTTIDLAADESCLSKDDVARFLLMMERLLVRAAHDDLPLEEVGRVLADS